MVMSRVAATTLPSGLAGCCSQTINPKKWMNREAAGYLYVKKTGETLYRLR